MLVPRMSATMETQPVQDISVRNVVETTVIVGQGPNCAPSSPLQALRLYRVNMIAPINPRIHQSQARRFVGVAIIVLATAARPAGAARGSPTDSFILRSLSSQGQGRGAAGQPPPLDAVAGTVGRVWRCSPITPLSDGRRRVGDNRRLCGYDSRSALESSRFFRSGRIRCSVACDTMCETKPRRDREGSGSRRR